MFKKTKKLLYKNIFCRKSYLKTKLVEFIINKQSIFYYKIVSNRLFIFFCNIIEQEDIIQTIFNILSFYIILLLLIWQIYYLVNKKRYYKYFIKFNINFISLLFINIKVYINNLLLNFKFYKNLVNYKIAKIYGFIQLVLIFMSLIIIQQFNVFNNIIILYQCWVNNPYINPTYHIIKFRFRMVKHLLYKFSNIRIISFLNYFIHTFYKNIMFKYFKQNYLYYKWQNLLNIYTINIFLIIRLKNIILSTFKKSIFLFPYKFLLILHNKNNNI